MFSIILVIFSTTETENDSFLPPKAFFTLSFISFTDTITKFPPKNAYNSPVSINTPTKGVTRADFSFCAGGIVSIHTPTKGVTPPQSKESILDFVSIHTPTKGVTWFSSKCAAC